MHYTKEEKKAIEFIEDKMAESYESIHSEDGKSIEFSTKESMYYSLILEIIKKQQKEIYRLENKEYMKLEKDNQEWKKELNEKDKSDIEFIINDIRSGKKLVNKALSDYIDLLSKEIKLQCISGYTIDRIIELFLNGFVFVNEEKIKRLKGIEEDYIRRMKTSNKVLLKQGYVPIEKYNELLNSKVGVDLVYDDCISKEAIREKIKELSEEDRTYTDELSEPDSNFKIIDKNLKRIKNQTDILKELLGE